MNKAWFFGDSFTAGDTAREGSEYYCHFGPGITFPEIISNHFNFEEVNTAQPGCCNETILTRLIENIKNIKEGDLVVIGNTSPLRGLTPSNDGTKLIFQKLFDSKPYSESKGYNDSKAAEVLLQYCVKYKSGYEELWSSHYNKMFIDILKYLNTKNIKGILWDYSVWSEEITPGMKFENIKEHTKGSIYDLHWSYKGHKKASEWILKGLELNKIYLK